jgi:hypothetical protein
MNQIFLPDLISPHPMYWMAAPASPFGFFMQRALQLFDSTPQLSQLFEGDLKNAALVDKEARLKDRQALYQQHPFLPDFEIETLPVTGIDSLAVGRPGMSSRTCFLFTMIRGYLGSIKARKAQDFLFESMSLRLYLISEGIKMPSLNSILDNINKISQKTLDAVFDALIQLIQNLGLDDFKEITIDSTVTDVNTCWPTDSGHMYIFSERVWRTLQKMDKFGLPNLTDPQIPEILSDMYRLNFEIALVGGRKDAEKIRKEIYEELIELAEDASQILRQALVPLRAKAKNTNLLPTTQEKLDQLLASLGDDLDRLCDVTYNAERRVLHGQKILTDERIVSASDPDAAFISKGQRETQVGYHPQVSKSAAGFVVAVDVAKGNVPDTVALPSITDLTIERTGVTPRVISVDDGYTSLKNRTDLEQRGVEIISFSGSKGKKITSEEDWVSEPYREARRMRSSVESVIFQIKQGFDFGQVARRGLDRVREELTAKVIAFNFYRLQYLTQI